MMFSATFGLCLHCCAPRYKTRRHGKSWACKGKLDGWSTFILAFKHAFFNPQHGLTGFKNPCIYFHRQQVLLKEIALVLSFAFCCVQAVIARIRKYQTLVLLQHAKPNNPSVKKKFCPQVQTRLGLLLSSLSTVSRFRLFF